MIGHEASVAAQVGEYLGPQRDAAATSRASDATPTTSRLVELTVTARADGVRVTGCCGMWHALLLPWRLMLPRLQATRGWVLPSRPPWRPL